MTDPVHKTGRVASEPFWAANEGAMGAVKACVSWVFAGCSDSSLEIEL